MITRRTMFCSTCSEAMSFEGPGSDELAWLDRHNGHALVEHGDNAPKIAHEGCTWLMCVADAGFGPPPAGALLCPACGKFIEATPEQIAQAKAADAAYERKRESQR